MKKWQKAIASQLVADVVRMAAVGGAVRKPVTGRMLRKRAKAAAKAAVLGMRKINAAN
jgi:hypothetical protein